jgi:hypothetical protein
MRSGSELFIYGLIVVAFLLFNFVMQILARKARQRQEEAARNAPRPAPTPAPIDDPLENIWGRGAPAESPVEPRRGTAAAVFVPEPSRPRPRAAPPVPGARARQAALFRSRQDLRHAIVVMTVLGPCRALDPYDRR